MRTVCHVHITMLTIKCHGLLAVGVFWGGVCLFWHLAIFGEANSSYCEFSGVLIGKRRRNQLWPYLGLEETILDVFLVDFGSLRPSGANGAGFRAIGGHLQVIFLQGSFQGHQGHFSAGAVWRLCASIFGDSKA